MFLTQWKKHFVSIGARTKGVMVILSDVFPMDAEIDPCI